MHVSMPTGNTTSVAYNNLQYHKWPDNRLIMYLLEICSRLEVCSRLAVPCDSRQQAQHPGQHAMILHSYEYMTLWYISRWQRTEYRSSSFLLLPREPGRRFSTLTGSLYWHGIFRDNQEAPLQFIADMTPVEAFPMSQPYAHW
jgi:hypothetical protein